MRDQHVTDYFSFDEKAGCCPADFALNRLALPKQERLVLRRIEAQDMIDLTASRLLHITPKTRIRGIGTAAMEQIVSIQRRVREVLLEISGDPKAQLRVGGLLVDPVVQRCQHGNVINHTLLSRQERKLLIRLETLYGKRPTVHQILRKDPEAPNKGLGHKSCATLAALQHRLWPEIAAHVRRGANATGAPVVPAIAGVPARTLLVSTRFQPLSAEAIAFITVDDLGVLLSSLKERSREIALARWGLRGTRQALGNLSARYGISRQRVSGIAQNTDALLPRFMRVHPAVLWANIKRYLNTGFTELLDLLQRHFDSPQFVAAFLERCCDVANGSIGDVVLPERASALGSSSSTTADAAAKAKSVVTATGRVLDSIFATTPQPVVEELVITALMSRHGWSALQAVHALGKLIDDSAVSRTDRGTLRPRRLSRRATTAFALLSHPRGLHLRDIDRLVSSYGLCRPRSSTGQRATLLDGNTWIYLCGPGTYRHVRYLPVSPNEISDILDAVCDHLRSTRYDDANLRSVHLAIANELWLDYYDLRHIVTTMGQERDLFFCGRSMGDTVSLHPRPAPLGLSETVYRLLEGTPHPLTREDIAGMLRSSAGAVSAALVPLIKSARITRVGIRKYTMTPTPDG